METGENRCSLATGGQGLAACMMAVQVAYSNHVNRLI